jgi:hypothetical protein
MKTQALVVPIAALAIAFGSLSSATAQNAERRNRGARSQNQERDRGDDSARPRTERAPDRDRTSARGGDERRERAERPERAERSERAERPERNRRAERSERRSDSADRERPRAETYTRDAYRGSREVQRSRSSDTRRDYDRDRYSDRGGGYSRGYSSGYRSGYYAPRRIDRRSWPRRYGSGGRLTLYFGIGSGYRYGSPYSGRVYGYRRSVPTYGNYVMYGDLRLKVSPRDAAVYVDGYYAGIVDDFDGFFQRLTLEVGPHEIEIEAVGFGSQVFDVYVDPERTIDLHADLLR